MGDEIESLKDFEMVFSRNMVPIDQLIFLELRDCDLTSGTPLYENKVKILQRTIESHHKIDEEYRENIKKTIKKIPDPKIILYNSRSPKHKQKQIIMVEIIDYEGRDKEIRNFLSRINITFKKERTSIL